MLKRIEYNQSHAYNLGYKDGYADAVDKLKSVFNSLMIETRDKAEIIKLMEE